ncbi:MAG: glycosyltransferase [Acidimicrobiales bacterium]
MTPLLGELSGVGQVVSAISQGLADDPSIELTGFAVAASGCSHDWLTWHQPVRHPLVVPVPARVAHLLWRRFVVAELTGFDVVHGANFVVPPGGGAIEVVTIHDLTAWRWPDLVSDSSRAFPGLVAQAIKRGAYVHAVSGFVAAEVHDMLGVAGDRIKRIYNGISASPDGDLRVVSSLAAVITSSRSGPSSREGLSIPDPCVCRASGVRSPS